MILLFTGLKREQLRQISAPIAISQVESDFDAVCSRARVGSLPDSDPLARGSPHAKLVCIRHVFLFLIFLNYSYLFGFFFSFTLLWGYADNIFCLNTKSKKGLHMLRPPIRDERFILIVGKHKLIVSYWCSQFVIGWKNKSTNNL